MVKLSDLTGKKGSEWRSDDATHGNVHMRVEAYTPADGPDGVGVQGIDLRTGKEITVYLANAEQFAKLYTDPTADQSVREQEARKIIANRPPLDEFAAKRGNRAVPSDGVIAFADVRQDYDSGKLYSRWPQGMVHIPGDEAALTGMFEVRTKVGQANGEKFTTTYVNYADVKNAFDPMLPGNATKATMDERIFSGTLPGITAPARTSGLIAVKLDEGVRTFALSGAKKATEQNGRKVWETIPGIDAALDREHSGYSAIAAAAFAAVIGKPFDSLKIAGEPETLAAMKGLYDGIRDGSLPVVVMPSAVLNVSKFQNADFLGKKFNKEGVAVEAKTAGVNLVDRGYFSGAVGVRFVSQRTGETVEPVIKAIDSDVRLPSKKSDAFQKLDLSAVGEIAFDEAGKALTHDATHDLAASHDHGGPDAEDDLDHGFDPAPDVSF